MQIDGGGVCMTPSLQSAPKGSYNTVAVSFLNQACLSTPKRLIGDSGLIVCIKKTLFAKPGSRESKRSQASMIMRSIRSELDWSSAHKYSPSRNAISGLISKSPSIGLIVMLSCEQVRLDANVILHHGAIISRVICRLAACDGLVSQDMVRLPLTVPV